MKYIQKRAMNDSSPHLKGLFNGRVGQQEAKVQRGIVRFTVSQVYLATHIENLSLGTIPASICHPPANSTVKFFRLIFKEGGSSTGMPSLDEVSQAVAPLPMACFLGLLAEFKKLIFEYLDKKGLTGLSKTCSPLWRLHILWHTRAPPFALSQQTIQLDWPCSHNWVQFIRHLEMQSFYGHSHTPGNVEDLAIVSMLEFFLNTTSSLSGMVEVSEFLERPRHPSGPKFPSSIINSLHELAILCKVFQSGIESYKLVDSSLIGLAPALFPPQDDRDNKLLRHIFFLDPFPFASVSEFDGFHDKYDAAYRLILIPFQSSINIATRYRRTIPTSQLDAIILIAMQPHSTSGSMFSCTYFGHFIYRNPLKGLKECTIFQLRKIYSKLCPTGASLPPDFANIFEEDIGRLLFTITTQKSHPLMTFRYWNMFPLFIPRIVLNSTVIVKEQVSESYAGDGYYFCKPEGSMMATQSTSGLAFSGPQVTIYNFFHNSCPLQGFNFLSSLLEGAMMPRTKVKNSEGNWLSEYEYRVSNSLNIPSPIHSYLQFTPYPANPVQAALAPEGPFLDLHREQNIKMPSKVLVSAPASCCMYSTHTSCRSYLASSFCTTLPHTSSTHPNPNQSPAPTHKSYPSTYLPSEQSGHHAFDPSLLQFGTLLNHRPTQFHFSTAPLDGRNHYLCKQFLRCATLPMGRGSDDVGICTYTTARAPWSMNEIAPNDRNMDNVTMLMSLFQIPLSEDGGITVWHEALTERSIAMPPA
ncbi:uncharacterized protein BDR25DRAFT_363018 [Lindgomyces ingoldianus]|uniref:Uncharacterized protein n=1 Tax=Lindgomyces ingoldianus TaxID=673940 RepID=A0ACB6QAZ2_9PLEO|nr:uncharacterized protein BDR25DRAFT_363018 [Lindgomyces ingoldianus]KAF2463297.1 hypothetical protein BDR25DRAFT_363018 [Lindgomyces ingoldianus]